MLENTPLPPPDSSAAVKRYVNPHRKNSLGRRKSGERIDRGNNVYGNDVGGGGSGAVMGENSYPPRHLVALEGCSRGPASQLLTNRWDAMMRIYNNVSIDLSERPIMYSGSNASAWGPFKLPHQIMSPANNVGPSAGSQMDFLSELNRAIQNANFSSNN